jgi:large subunit ribosomal protein L13
MKPKTYFAKKGEVARDWVIVDLKDQVLGRAATQIAIILRGKNKPQFTPHTDTGDFVVAINAEQVKLTGDKETKKIYYHHSGYPGGLKERTVDAVREKNPEEIIRLAVRGMLPKNKTNKHLMKKLKIYAGAEHPHTAQQPKEATA